MVDKKWLEVAHGLRARAGSMAAGDVAGALVADGELAAATLASQEPRGPRPARARRRGRVQVRGAAGLRRAHGGRSGGRDGVRKGGEADV